MMSAMEIRTTLNFPADPHIVFAMMSDPGFLKEVAAESGARNCRVTVSENRTISKRMIDAPGPAQKFTGPQIELVEEITWGAALPDGSRTAALRLNSPGQPMSMDGTIQLRPQGAGTVVTITGDLAIRVPLVGKKLEQIAAPAIYDGIRAEERVGLRRLSH